MMFPVAVENFQVKYFNPIIKPVAKFLPGMSTISHRGRKSGKPYETVVTRSARATRWRSRWATARPTG